MDQEGNMMKAGAKRNNREVKIRVQGKIISNVKIIRKTCEDFEEQ